MATVQSCVLSLKREGAININKVLVIVLVVVVLVGGLFALKYSRNHSAAMQYNNQTQPNAYASSTTATSSPMAVGSSAPTASPNSNADVDAEVKSMENNLNAVPSPDTSDPTQ